MSKWRCNECGQVYADAASDPNALPHTCYPEIIEHAQFDEEGKLIRAEVRTPRTVIRDERLAPGLSMSDGKWVRRAPHPEERGQFIEVPAESLIISEGKGRTQIE